MFLYLKAVSAHQQLEGMRRAVRQAHLQDVQAARQGNRRLLSAPAVGERRATPVGGEHRELRDAGTQTVRRGHSPLQLHIHLAGRYRFRFIVRRHHGIAVDRRTDAAQHHRSVQCPQLLVFTWNSQPTLRILPLLW